MTEQRSIVAVVAKIGPSKPAFVELRHQPAMVDVRVGEDERLDTGGPNGEVR